MKTRYIIIGLVVLLFVWMFWDDDKIEANNQNLKEQITDATANGNFADAYNLYDKLSYQDPDLNSKIL
ncbi:MAG: hypothetical protein J1E95_09970, partial [Muribaculaceae bacterium]|nr:hypothetical protein [Muribaculaceae bacterium]